MVLGADGMDALRRSHVAVFGLGGVGSYAVEALVRSGVGELTLIDDDTVALTALRSPTELKHKTPGRSDDIHDILIRNIYSYTFCWTGQVRLLAKSGCRIYSVSIDTVVNTIDESLPYRGGCSVMLGDCGYIRQRDIRMGELFNIRITNIHSRAIRAIRLIASTMANAVTEGRQGEENTEAPAAEAEAPAAAE